MTDMITTQRLTLRRFNSADIPVIAHALQDKDIVRMIPILPWPYGLADATTYVEETAPSQPMTFAIEHNGALRGSVSLGNQLGYWLCRDAWGQGFATEASRSLLQIGFENGLTHVLSGHRPENSGSRGVLQKLGFKNTGIRVAWCHADGCDVTIQNMDLSREDWEASQ